MIESHYVIQISNMVRGRCLYDIRNTDWVRNGWPSVIRVQGWGDILKMGSTRFSSDRFIQGKGYIYLYGHIKDKVVFT